MCKAKPAEGALTRVLTACCSLCFLYWHFLFGGYKPDTEHMAGCEVVPVYLPYRSFSIVYSAWLSVYYSAWLFWLLISWICPFALFTWLDWCLCMSLLPAYWLSSFVLPLCMSTDSTVTLVLTLWLTSRFCLLQILLINFCEWILVLPQRRPYRILRQRWIQQKFQICRRRSLTKVNC